ncbi:MAG: TetR family transcriptional regulator [Nocardioidaceae bacterium]|nr:TetR family transcriptional regulator [Nocardioidaceae bacterium]
MVRWEPNARDRLGQAAMELYTEHGYEQTTVAEIAGRAGLTERTFFRHFADKREVLFDGSAALQDAMVGALVAAPASAAPIEAVSAAVEAAGAVLQERRDHALVRQAVIAANPELQERELIKMARLAAALSAALCERGVTASVADLAAQAGIAVFHLSFVAWISAADSPDFPEIVRRTFAELRSVTAGQTG